MLALLDCQQIKYQQKYSHGVGVRRPSVNIFSGPVGNFNARSCGKVPGSCLTSYHACLQVWGTFTVILKVILGLQVLIFHTFHTANRTEIYIRVNAVRARYSRRGQHDRH